MKGDGLNSKAKPIVMVVGYQAALTLRPKLPRLKRDRGSTTACAGGISQPGKCLSGQAACCSVN